MNEERKARFTANKKARKLAEREARRIAGLKAEFDSHGWKPIKAESMRRAHLRDVVMEAR